MILFENITFLMPIYFVFIVPIFCVLLYIYLKKGKNNYFSGFSDLQKVYGQNSFFYKFYFVLLFGISFLFLSILAHPVEYSSEEEVKKNGIDIELVMDLSYSMIAEDLKPNRLEVAKEVLKDFIDSRETDRIGLILFSGKPFTSVPLSFDYEFLKQYISDISIETIDRKYTQLGGTAIGDGLVLAYDTLKQEENTQAGLSGKDKNEQSEAEKIIILITDGEANAGIDPVVALKILKQEKIKTYTIGVGGLEETFIELVDDFGFKQKFAVGGVDESTLKTIASETGGVYYRATSGEMLEEIFESISKLERREIQQRIVQAQKDAYEPFLYTLILLFFLLLGLIYRKNIMI